MVSKILDSEKSKLKESKSENLLSKLAKYYTVCLLKALNLRQYVDCREYLFAAAPASKAYGHKAGTFTSRNKVVRAPVISIPARACSEIA